jgi:3-oxoadipate enol-lactonase
MPVAEVNGLEVYHELHGAGPPLLNISGSGGDLRHSFPERSPLNKHFRVLSYDQRGLGRTSKPDEEYTMADYADDAAALVRAVGWERCHVVGTSFGGMVALNLVLAHPDLVERLVLCCTSPGGEAPSYPLHELRELSPEVAFPVRMRLLDRRWDPAADEPIPGLGPFYDAVVAGAVHRPQADVAAGLERQLQARAGHDVVGRLGEIEHDTLVCAGRYDDLAPVANSERIARRMPHAELQVFDGGHLFMVQDRQAYPTIIDFLTGPR